MRLAKRAEAQPGATNVRSIWIATTIAPVDTQSIHQNALCKYVTLRPVDCIVLLTRIQHTVSGEAPEEPVVSKKTGTVFEKRLIEKYVEENGKDPVTGEELDLEDLLPIKSARVVRPRPPTLTSIPALLSTFQNEWDALALETFKLKQQLSQTRDELANALYQHDAAVRVIARLSKERDEARAALSRVTVSAGSGANGDAMAVDNEALPEVLAEHVDETQAKYAILHQQTLFANVN